MERCDGGSGNTKEDIGIESQTFTNRDYGETPHPTLLTRSHPTWEVQSAVYVTRNAALAARRVRLAGSARARDCLKRLIEAGSSRRAVGSNANEPPKIEVSALPSPLPGVPVYGMRSIFCFALFSSLPCNQRYAFTISDYLGFAVGATLVTLHDTGLERAFPSTTERRLLTLLYKRAEATFAGRRESTGSTPQISQSQVFRVPSGSMEPTLPIGTMVVVKEGPPTMGTIVIFHPPEGSELEECGPKHHVLRPGGAACDAPLPEESKVEFIKRIVAGPGDEIYVRRGHVYRKVNGSHEFVRESDSYIRACGGRPECDLPVPIKIPAGHWFLMGDNRGESDDSRFWGPVPTAWIVGTATDYVLRGRHFS
jgi:signal peptidase I